MLPWPSNIDSLIQKFQKSTAELYTNLVRDYGRSDGEPLANHFQQDSIIDSYIRRSVRLKSYVLPAGTDKIRFKAVSGFWNKHLKADNIRLQVPCIPGFQICYVNARRTLYTKSVNVSCWIQSEHLHRTDFPNVIVDSAKLRMNFSGCFNHTFSNALSGSYYFVFKHRNTIETWTNCRITELYKRNIFFYDLINKYACLSEIKNIAPYYAMYSIDINVDNIIDGSDPQA